MAIMDSFTGLSPFEVYRMAKQMESHFYPTIHSIERRSLELPGYVQRLEMLRDSSRRQTANAINPKSMLFAGV